MKHVCMVCTSFCFLSVCSFSQNVEISQDTISTTDSIEAQTEKPLAKGTSRIFTPNRVKFLVGLGGGLFEAAILAGVTSGYGDNDGEAILSFIVGASAGYAIGCPIGVKIYGNFAGQKGSLFSSMSGMFIGTAASGLIALGLYGLGVDSDVAAGITIPLACITGPIGSVIAHNISSRRPSGFRKAMRQ